MYEELTFRLGIVFAEVTDEQHFRVFLLMTQNLQLDPIGVVADLALVELLRFIRVVDHDVIFQVR